MKRYLLPLLTPLFITCFFSISYAQNNKVTIKSQQTPMSSEEKEKIKNDPNIFNEEAAIERAKTEGIKNNEIEGYIQYLKSDFYSKASLKYQTHKHTPYENNFAAQEKVIVFPPNKTMSIGCPNASFEQYDFTNWTGQNGTYSGSASSVTYNLTNGIINTIGLNAPLGNTINYHTLLTVPPTNPNYPNCVGYDSIAVPVGGTISEIPFISPYSLDGVSCRLLGAFGGAKVSKLKYIMSVGPNSKLFRYSFAVVLNDGHSGDPTTHQPYFKVSVKDQSGNPILGCQDFNQDATTAQSAGGFKTSHLTYGGNNIIYKPWTLVSIDLSAPSYSTITSISIEFEVAGCTATGHLGYAYVDAECGMGGIASSYCGGSNAILTAPQGYTNYQWFDPSNNPIAAPSGTNSVLTVTAPVIGDVYTVNLSTPGGCTMSLTNTLSVTAVSISYLNSAPSCAGGHSGIATVNAIGSTGVYTYSWTSISTGSIVSNSQTATGLAPGNYSVIVESPGCGQASANLSVGTSPPFYISQIHPFCGNSTYIIKTGGSNYKWYQGSTLIPGPNGTNDTLFISNAVSGAHYSLVYSNSFGCTDSIRYTLSPVAGGNVYFSNINNVCPGNSNGSVQLNLSTPFSAPYSYSVTNSSGTIILNTSTTATNVNVSPLAIGSYSAVTYDGTCIYTNTFTISNIITSFTASATNTVICFPSDTAKIYLNFGATAPSYCSLDPAVCNSVNPLTLFTTGSFTQNSTTNYPTPYGNWYTYAKHQFLVQKSDLNAAGIVAGKISSLAFKVINLNTSITNYPNFSIKMGCTNLSTMPSPTTPFISGLQTVYSTANQPISLGWVTHNFNQAYVWDGASNIIIEVCFGMNTSSNYSHNASIELKQVPYQASLWYREDQNPVCNGSQQADNVGAMTNGINMLPNMQFGYCSYSEPAANYTVSISSNGNITENNGNDSLKVVPTFTAPPYPSAPTVYTFTAINPIGGCVGTTTFAVLYPANTTTITSVSTTSSICIGSQVSLFANGTVYYNWSYLQGGTTLIPISTSQTINVTPPAAGPNYYVVTGTSPCSLSSDTKTITVITTPKADLMISPLVDVTKCMNRDFIVNTGVSSTNSVTGTPYTYNWTTLPGGLPAPGNNTSSSYTYSSNGTTTLVVTVNGNCANATRDTVVISNFADNLAISIVDSSYTCAGTEFQLHTSLSGGHPDYNYAWFFGSNPNVISNSTVFSYISPNTEGTYTIVVQVTDSCGYTKYDEQLITVLPPCNIESPNIITPNGDGVNETFTIRNIERHPNTSLTIFDRWGKKVFASSDYKNDWKGEGVSDGTFFYVIDVPDDKSYNGFITVFSGK